MTRDLFLVIDIGKTNSKIVVAETATGQPVWSAERNNAVHQGPPYHQLDTQGIEAWLMDTLPAVPDKARIGTVVPVAHGAAIVPIDGAGEALAAPDYEDPAIESVAAAYARERDPFAATLSPELPLGLNVGRQLFYLETGHPMLFRRIAHVLAHPQYWAWRLCGTMATEVTSLGAHTDLWLPLDQRFSPLAERRGWSRLFPSLRRADEALGKLRPEIVRRTGFSDDCRVLCGIHDSNASYLTHLAAFGRDRPFAVCSTGTWVIVLANGVDLSRLDAARDMLANVDVYGRPVATARFMGGREYAVLLAGGIATPDVPAVGGVVARGLFALPHFAAAGGPFHGSRGRLVGGEPVDATERAALATLYLALVVDTMLDLLGVSGNVIVEGAFTANPLFGPILAALRPADAVLVGRGRPGTVSGARLLVGAGPAEAGGQPVKPLAGVDLAGYRAQWQRLVARARDVSA
jgi:L-fuculokinase